MNQTSSLKSFMHYPVMLKEVIKVCSPEKGGLIVDCTYGSGGYTNALLAYPNTKVIALDRDSKVEKFVAKTNKKYKSRFSFHNLKFSEISKAIPKNLKADTVIFDLGLSSIQINAVGN